MKPTWYIVCILSSILFVTSCKKGGGSSSPAATLPAIKTIEGSAITATTAQSGGTITSDGGSAITARGVCWTDILSSPTIADSKTNDGTGTGTFTSALTTLEPYRAYTVRAFATNSAGTSYGNNVIILTAPGVTLHTSDITVSRYKRSCETNVIISGFDVPSFKPITQSGICWSTSQNPTIADAYINNGPITAVVSHFIISPLFGINSTYYIRAFAMSSTGTTYGNQITYSTGIDIGLGYGGGIIFYVDNTGQHGLIAALSDQGAGIPWAPVGLANVITNASSSTDGASNTTNIINTYGNAGVYAAKICRDYQGGGFTDWYLPSGDELNTMNLYEDVVGNFPPPVDFTQFYYWSSTEYDYFRAWIYEFNPLYYEHHSEVKDKECSVRAVRSF